MLLANNAGSVCIGLKNNEAWPKFAGSYKKSVCYIFSCRPTVAAKSVCTSGWFIRMENVHPVLTIMFENILGTFEAEILKIS